MIYCLLIVLLSIQTLYCKGIDFDPIPEENGNTANHPYIGLPVTTWTIKQLSNSEKQNTCSNQLLFCKDQCGSDGNTQKNFCNMNTMAWGCTCKDQVPTAPPYHWPVSVAECHGKESSCINACSDGVTKDLCTKACSRYYRCDQAGSPPSGLKVDDIDKAPIYQVPVSEGSIRPFSLVLIYASVITNLCLSLYNVFYT